MGCCFSTSNRVADVNEVKPVKKKTSTEQQQQQQQQKAVVRDKPPSRVEHRDVNVDLIDDESIEPSLQSEIDYWRELVDDLNKNGDLTGYALAKQRTDFDSFDAVVDYLSKGPFHNDIEKAWLIFVWITDNIDYDGEAYRTGNYGKSDPDSVLKSGRAVCGGYATFYESLAKRLNLECKRLNGYSKAFGYQIGSKMVKEDHSWNAVKIVNKWRYVEPTWGAGYLEKTLNFVKNFKPYNFFTPPRIFIERHFNPKFQLQKNKLTLAEFQQLQVNELEFHLLGLKCLTHDMCIIYAQTNPIFVEFMSKQDVVFTTTLFNQQTGKEYKNKVLVQTEYDPTTRDYKYGFIVFTPVKEEPYEFNIFGKLRAKDDGTVFPLLSEYLIVRQSDDRLDPGLIPAYNLMFNHNIRLVSHHCSLVEFDTNLLTMKFHCPTSTLILFKVKDTNDSELENSVLKHDDFTDDDGDTLVEVALPVQNKPFQLQMFAKNAPNDDDSYKLVYAFRVIRKGTDLNDNMKLVNVLPCKIKFHIFYPINYAIKANEVYEFKYLVKNAQKVALLDGKKNWLYLNKSKDPNDHDVWVIEKAIINLGELSLYAQFDDDKSFKGICKYTVIT